MTEQRIFLLSPASCRGPRATMLLAPDAGFDLARQVRQQRGVPIGDVFAFLSALYFRGKLVYACTFARPPRPRRAATGEGVLVITPSLGLVQPETPVTADTLLEFAGVQVDSGNEAYRVPLEKTARALARAIRADAQVVLLGSIATSKYVDVLLEVFSDRLCFPAAFVGRGDMSRGGLMLRCVDEARELEYIPVAGAVRHGSRPPKLAPRRRTQG
jgi:hypothetical protein